MYSNILLVILVVSISCVFLPLFNAQSSDSGISSDKDWRCAIFLLPEPGNESESGNISATRVWSFPTRFKTSCALPNPTIYNRTCFEIMKRSFRQWSYNATSELDRKSGKKIGDDFCTLIGKNEIHGREIGFFFNYCGNPEWIDTTLRRRDKVCCLDGTYSPCPMS